MPVRLRSAIPSLLASASAALLAGCGHPEPVAPPRLAVAPAMVEQLEMFRPQPVGAPATGRPWIAHVATADLDRDGLLDVLVCDAEKNQVTWIRQTARGQFTETPLLTDISAPVRATPADIDGDGDTDLLVASMGQIFPNNDKIGTLVLLENDGRQHFTRHLLLDRVDRLTDVQVGDFNADGRPDLALAQFGYDQGQVQWLENLGGHRFKPHPLLALSGAINVCVADFNGDRTPDIAALLSQQWEEIYLFENDGRGTFTNKVVWGSTNEDYGSSGLSSGDLNGDGRPDLLYTNGDGFGPSVLPGPRPWHGVQWLENTGGGQFRYHRIGHLPGAYSPVGVDLDGDGAQDFVAASAYANLRGGQPLTPSLVWYRNDGRLTFTPHVLARGPKDLITLAPGDLDGDGRPALVTGGFYVVPPYDHLSRVTVWHRALLTPAQPAVTVR